MHASPLTPDQVDLLLHAGVFGLCRVPADAVEAVNALREAGLVELNDERCFQLTRRGERRVVELVGTPRNATLH